LLREKKKKERESNLRRIASYRKLEKSREAKDVEGASTDGMQARGGGCNGKGGYIDAGALPEGGGGKGRKRERTATRPAWRPVQLKGGKTRDRKT